MADAVVATTPTTDNRVVFAYIKKEEFGQGFPYGRIFGQRFAYGRTPSLCFANRLSTVNEPTRVE